MSRRHITFASESSMLIGSIDEAPETTGLLLVTGGNEVRAGAWNGQAQFAARIASEGFPVMRFDRRGVGDSEGPNGEFRLSGPDMADALAAFRAECPHIQRVVGFGNCDAASALMLAGGAGCDALVLSNPWTFDAGDEDDTPPEAVRDHYKRRLTDPAAIKRLLTGQVSLRKLASSLVGALRPSSPMSGLAQEMADGLEGFAGPVRFLVAERDRTGQAFLSAWPKGDARIRTCPGASHSYVEHEAQGWLVAQVLEMLRG